MQKFTKLITFINDREHELAKELVHAATRKQKRTVILNACHEEVKGILEKALEILQEDLHVEDEKPRKRRHLSVAE